MATSQVIGKRGPDWSSAPKMLSFGEMIAKISPVVDRRAIIKKRKEINASKIYSPVGKCAYSGLKSLMSLGYTQNFWLE